MELKLNQEEVKEIIKKHLESQFGHEVKSIEVSSYSSEMTIELGKKKVEPNYVNYPWATQTHPNTAIPRGASLTTSIDSASELKSVTGARPRNISDHTTDAMSYYDGADTPASTQTIF